MEKAYYDSSIILEPYLQGKKEETHVKYCVNLINYSAGKIFEPIISDLVWGEINRRLTKAKNTKIRIR